MKIAPLTTEGIVKSYRQISQGGVSSYRVPALWDGKAAERIAKIIASSYKAE